MTPFDLTGDLPRGTTLLEASAGTGKTYTIAGLVTRWVAETELRLPQLLVVTFTRAATAELRDRVRRRLVGAADHLEAVQAGSHAHSDDPVLSLLAAAPEEEIGRRRRRLGRALGDIDAATIATIHGFCQHVLDGLGLASDLDRDAELVEDQSDLIEEVVDDLLVETYLADPDRPRIDRRELLTLGRAAVANPTTALAPRDPSEPEIGLRLHLAQRIRGEVTHRARRRRLLSYDDLLTRLDATLADPERGEAAAQALRQRYKVALIDEFQDTDPVQWSIVERAFGDDAGDGDDRALVLIGDPKQAIYAFRGADVYAYLQAKEAARTRHTLGTSWRADADLLTAFDTLLDGATFGDEDIAHQSVEPAPGHDRPRLCGAPAQTALRLRLLPRHPDLPTSRDGKIVADRAREVIARDVAADVVRLLESRPELLQRDADGAETGRRGLEPRDVGVLVRSNAEAALVQESLQQVDVPAVINGVESVFATTAATHWRRLLDALERPASVTRVRALALSSWVGWTGEDVAEADEAAWDRLHDDVHRWAALLRERGVATLQRTVLIQREVRPRLLARSDGERLLADLEHTGELLHAAATAEHLGAAALTGWLRDRIADAGSEQQDERLRRLETDDDAVQILTIHRSKGLEFPVVYCPFLWSSSTTVRGVPVFHDDDRRRRLDVGGDHPRSEEHRARAEREARGEELRLLYVAMTRARHQVVAHYAPAGMPEWSSLGRMLLCRGADGRVDTARQAPIPDDRDVREAAEALAERAGGTIDVATVPAEPSPAPWRPPPVDLAPLDTAVFDRSLDGAWRRTSYSALTRVESPPARVRSEPDEAVKDDEALPGGTPTRAVEDDPGGLRAHGLPLAEMPGGTEVGTFVHHVLEHVDFAAEDLEGELGRVVIEQHRRRRVQVDAGRLVTGLGHMIDTPLGLGDAVPSLRALTRRDRRDEVDFELPLHRRADSRPATVDDLADLLLDHLPDTDPLAEYPEHLPATLRHRDLRGFLAGSIDLVMRRDGGAGPPTFHVVDYKTNRLAPPGEELTAWHYRQPALADAMMHGHYPIQALLYDVALHRLLRWRLPGYDPAVHLGAVQYLFVRGMAGPDTPMDDRGRSCGVFTWEVPPALIRATSELLHGVDA